MIRLYVIAGLSLALCAAVAAFYVQRGTITDIRTELALCLAYQSTTNEVRDATSNLPTAVDDVLDSLRDYATGGQGKRNP